MTEVVERTDDGVQKDDGYMRSKGTGEYSRMHDLHSVTAQEMILMKYEMLIRGCQGEVEKKSEKEKAEWTVAVCGRTGHHDSGTGEQRGWHQTAKEQLPQERSGDVRARKRRTRMSMVSFRRHCFILEGSKAARSFNHLPKVDVSSLNLAVASDLSPLGTSVCSSSQRGIARNVEI